MRRRLIPLLLAGGLGLLWASSASAFTKTDGPVTMSDGVTLMTSYYVPDGTPPAAGWPAILMLHGLGGTRNDTNALAEAYYVPQGYAVLTYDVRGHGQSGGFVGIAGPHKLSDVGELFNNLAARPGIDRAHIGAWGISYGGGQILDSLVAGVPFAAVSVYETWTDLFSALFPQNQPKSGIVGGFLNEIPSSKLDPEYTWVPNDAIHGLELDRLHALADPRSSLNGLGRVTTPIFMLQGRRDFAFGIDQAIAVYTHAGGPKRLYIGDHGHAPSSFPAPDTDYSMTETRMWFDRYLKGMPNGIDTKPPVEVAPNPWKGQAVSYPGLPPTKSTSFAAPGKTTISANGLVIRSLGATKTPLEEFGSPTVTVSVTPKGGWSRLTAVLTATSAGAKPTVVSGGGVPLSGPGTVTIKMISDATFIPAGSKLQLWLSASTTKTPAGLLYLDLGLPAGAKLTIGKATVSVPALAKPISG